MKTYFEKLENLNLKFRDGGREVNTIIFFLFQFKLKVGPSANTFLNSP